MWWNIRQYKLTYDYIIVDKPLLSFFSPCIFKDVHLSHIIYKNIFILAQNYAN
jgi:hypothetical protein